MSLVAECRTMSAPRSSGRWRSGVANVASTTVIAPRSRAPAAIAGMSATTMSGLAIDSTHTMSAPSAAASTASVSSAATMRTVRRPSDCIRPKMFLTP